MSTFGTAVWHGGLKDGKGALSTKSGALKDYPYGFASRFEGKPGSNPEELIGAAHAGCFTMSLANLLTESGHPPDDLQTSAKVRLEQLETGFAITNIALDTVGDVPGVDADTFATLARQAKDTCPVSRALAGTEITLEARLASD